MIYMKARLTGNKLSLLPEGSHEKEELQNFQKTLSPRFFQSGDTWIEINLECLCIADQSIPNSISSPI